MENTVEKTKLMTSDVNDIHKQTKVKAQKLGAVTNFEYLAAIVSDEGSKPRILSRTEQATAPVTKLKPICRNKSISLGSKVKLMRFFVISIILYACESWP